MKQLLKQKKGMTLIELMLSLTILAIVVLPFSGMFLNSAKIESSSANYMEATQWAQEKMEELKNNDSALPESKISLDGEVDPKLDPLYRGKLKMEILYYNFSSINKYNVSSAGLPSYYDIAAKLEENAAVPENANTVFYYYYDGVEKAFPLGTSKDIIDADLTSSALNTRMLRLSQTADGKVRIAISKANGEILTADVPLKTVGEEYNFKIECLGSSTGNELEYQIVNGSGRKLNIYKLVYPVVDPVTGKEEISENNVRIDILDGIVNIKSNTVGKDFTNGKHYKILVRVKDSNNKVLTELYGISR